MKRLLFTACLVLACQGRAFAAEPPPPIISTFALARPVIARHGRVVSQDAAASRVGLEVSSTIHPS